MGAAIVRFSLGGRLEAHRPKIVSLVTRLGSQLERYLVLCHAEILGTGCERQFIN